MEAETLTKFAKTQRIIFKRRHRMKDRNLLIIYFDGVIGDLPYCTGQYFGINAFRIRSGAIRDLRELSN